MKTDAALFLTVLLCLAVCESSARSFFSRAKRDSNYEELEQYFSSLVQNEKQPTEEKQGEVVDLEDLLNRYGVDVNEDEESVKQYDRDFLNRYANDLEADEQNVKKTVYGTHVSGYVQPRVRPQSYRPVGRKGAQKGKYPRRYYTKTPRRNLHVSGEAQDEVLRY